MTLSHFASPVYSLWNFHTNTMSDRYSELNKYSTKTTAVIFKGLNWLKFEYFCWKCYNGRTEYKLKTSTQWTFSNLFFGQLIYMVAFHSLDCAVQPFNNYLTAGRNRHICFNFLLNFRCRYINDNTMVCISFIGSFQQDNNISFIFLR